MQYADVAIARRLGAESDPLTYAIPPELLPDIRAGSVVDVPFRARTTRGIVVRLRATLPDSQLKNRLRPIRRIISPWPVLGSQELALRTTLANTTHSAIHQTATLLLPPPSLYKTLSTPAPESSGVGQFRYVIGAYQHGFQTILPTLEQALARDLSILILTATKTLAKDVTAELTRRHPSTTITQFSPQGSVASQRLAWNIALGSTTGVVVGTRSASLLPFRQLGAIVILDPADRQFTEEQIPRYDALAVAQLRRQTFGADLIALGALPPLALFTPSQRSTLTITRAHEHVPQIIISARHRPTVLQATTIERIHALLANNKQVVIVVPRRGWAAGLVCQECSTVIHCPTCGHLLHVTDATSRLRCEICRTEHRETRCPMCASPRLTTFGWGSERFLTELQTLFSAATVVTDDGDALPKHWQILVTTPDRLSRSLITADLIVAVEPERSLLTTDYRALEQYLRHLADLRQRAGSELILETRMPEQAAFRELQRALPRATLTEELALRKQHGYPPFGTLLTLIWPDTPSAQAVAAELRTRLSALLSPDQLVGPSRLTTKSGQAAYRLLIKLPRTGDQALIRSILAQLPANTRWRIET